MIEESVKPGFRKVMQEHSLVDQGFNVKDRQMKPEDLALKDIYHKNLV